MPLILVALSGGADSLALAAATAFEAPRAGVRAGAVVIDHDLQQGSEQVAARAATQARALGLEPVVVRRVVVGEHSGGPEAAARHARYAAFEQVLTETGAVALLTAHTEDDQAEQVLLALARGSGTRAIAGIPARRDSIVRPFLGVSRETTEAACLAQGLDFWHDPHNADPSYTRVRVRTRVLPLLEEELGPGVAVNLARSAEVASEDADALDALAAELLAAVVLPATDAHAAGGRHEVSLSVAVLAEQPAALRNRVVRHAAREHFGSHLSREHTLQICDLVTDWHGQGPIHVPGISASRSGAELRLCAH